MIQNILINMIKEISLKDNKFYLVEEKFVKQVFMLHVCHTQ